MGLAFWSAVFAEAAGVTRGCWRGQMLYALLHGFVPPERFIWEGSEIAF